MLIDKNGRLFGKFGLIDLAVVFVLLVVGAFIFKRFVIDGALKQGEEIVVQYYTEDVLDFVADVINLGDKIEDEGKNLDLGVVTDIVKNPGFYYVADDQGVMHKAEREGITNLILTGVVKGQMFANGFMIDGNKYGVGHGMTIRAGKAKIYLRISGIDRKSDIESQ